MAATPAAAMAGPGALNVAVASAPTAPRPNDRIGPLIFCNARTTGWFAQAISMIRATHPSRSQLPLPRARTCLLAAELFCLTPEIESHAKKRMPPHFPGVTRYHLAGDSLTLED
jgi:hypothetical protein